MFFLILWPRLAIGGMPISVAFLEQGNLNGLELGLHVFQRGRSGKLRSIHSGSLIGGMHSSHMPYYLVRGEKLAELFNIAESNRYR